MDNTRLPHLNALKAFVEGERDLQEWPRWWQENAQLIEENEGRTSYLKIKLKWQEGAFQILEHHRIIFKSDESVNWDRCKECGQPLFHAIPHKTTEEQIREFAQKSNLSDKEEIRRAGWIHPGTYCPNGCTEVLTSYSRDKE